MPRGVTDHFKIKGTFSITTSARGSIAKSKFRTDGGCREAQSSDRHGREAQSSDRPEDGREAQSSDRPSLPTSRSTIFRQRQGAAKYIFRQAGSLCREEPLQTDTRLNKRLVLVSLFSGAREISSNNDLRLAL